MEVGGRRPIIDVNCESNSTGVVYWTKFAQSACAVVGDLDSAGFHALPFAL